MAIQLRGGMPEKMIPDKMVRAVAFGMQRRRDLKARWLHGKYAAVEERAACRGAHKREYLARVASRPVKVDHVVDNACRMHV